MSNLPSDLVTVGGELCVTIAEAKDHLHLWSGDASCEPMLTTYTRAAQARVEIDTRRGCSVQSRIKSQHGFPRHGERSIPLPMSPLVSVESIEYLSGGTWVAMDAADYYTDAREPALIWLADGASWPTTDRFENSVRINYTAGMDNTHALYDVGRCAVLLLVGESYENRQAIAEVQSSTYDALSRRLYAGGWPGASR